MGFYKAARKERFFQKAPLKSLLFSPCQNKTACENIHMKMFSPTGLFSCELKSFSFERFCMRACFETETQGTYSKIAY